ncbi:MAG TPA: hypothetical protein VFZ78_05725 [Flavisolibacter sp.]
MNLYLRHIFIYFEQVLHPASGWSGSAEKIKRKPKKQTGSQSLSPDSSNMRGAVKKNDKLRYNPAP